MAHRRCRMVAVRDPLTARGLRAHGVRALAPGNPMMDGFQCRELPAGLSAPHRLILLPGSRLPEALGNFKRLMGCLPDAAQCGHLGGLTVLVPVGRKLHDTVAPLLSEIHFQPAPPPLGIGVQTAWKTRDLELWLGVGCFEDWAPWAQVGLATAGTATEQLVGLGLPVVSLPGPGPQFTAGFARRQSRLLGGAVQPFRTQAEVRHHLLALLEDSGLRTAQGLRGKRRMGPPGGSDALARLIADRLLLPQPAPIEER